MTEFPENEVEKIIGYKFNNITLLQTALTHSTINDANHVEVNGGISNYQRLEYLGDALLDFIVAEELFKLYPNYDEGKLTKIRANIVSKTPLAKVIEGAGIVNYIHKINLNINAISEKVKSDLFEAILCAIYLDSGSVATAREFVIRYLGENIKSAQETELLDYKSILIEYCVRENKQYSFECNDVTGPPHALVFSYTLLVNGVEIARASGKTKRVAQQECAKEGCRMYGIINH